MPRSIIKVCVLPQLSEQRQSLEPFRSKDHVPLLCLVTVDAATVKKGKKESHQQSIYYADQSNPLAVCLLCVTQGLDETRPRSYR